MKKVNINPKTLYIATISAFFLIILFFSAIYPKTMDELRFSHDTWPLVFKQIKLTLTTDSPRFLMIFDILFLHFPKTWKIVYTLLNPFVQLFIIFGMFFVITGRKVNFNTKQDFYPFFLIVLMYLFMIPWPAHTLFWQAGAICYSWAFVPVLILLCLFKKSIDGTIFKSSALKNFLMLFIGFASGMSNENTGPMIFCLTVLFFIYCKYKKIKIPQFYYFALVGIILGLTAMFGSGAAAARMKRDAFVISWQEMTLTNKILIFIAQMNKVLDATFWLPVINFIGLVFVLYDKKLKMLKNKEFVLSALFWLCGVVLSAVLFMPIDLRAYYSSAVFFFISFIILLLLARQIYSINFTKYICLLLLITGIISAPFITIIHINLYKQDTLRRNIAAQARKIQGKEATIFVPKIVALKGPTFNWTIDYYDILCPWFEEQLKKEFDGDIYFDYFNN